MFVSPPIIPPSMKFAKAAAERFRYLAGQLQLQYEPGTEQDILLAALGFEDWASLTTAQRSGPPSPLDEACEPRDLKLRYEMQALALSMTIGNYMDESLYFVKLWKPSGAPPEEVPRRVSTTVSEGLVFTSLTAAPSGYTAEHYRLACETQLREGNDTNAERIANAAIEQDGIESKAFFLDVLAAIGKREISAQLNLGVALIQIKPPERDVPRGVAILKSLDASKLTAAMREVALVVLAQVSDGRYGGRKDPAEAKRILATAAAEGSRHAVLAQAVECLAACDFDSARGLFTVASEAGMGEAKHALVRMMFLGQTDLDVTEARRLIKEMKSTGTDVTDLETAMTYLAKV